MSDPGLPAFSEERSSAQQPAPGRLKVSQEWYRKFCDSNPACLIHGWDGLHPLARERRAVCYLPFGLKRDVVDKLIRLNAQGIRRLLNLVTGFQDIFLFSDPERFPNVIYSREYRLFMKWLISVDVYHPGMATSQWKKFITLVKWKALRSRTEPPPIPTCFPGVPRNRSASQNMVIPVFWAALCPWLVPIWSQGVQSKFECTRLAHFLTSRNLPAGTKADRIRTLAEHAEVLCAPPPAENPTRATFLYELAYHFGKWIRERYGVSLSSAHTSITNSASLDAPVNRGGRAADVREKFRIWLSEVSQVDKLEVTWFGKPYWLQKGVARWRTMCRTRIPLDGRPGDSSFIEDVDFTPGKYRYEDPLYCLDRYTGYQLYQWSIEEGIRTGALSGTPFKSERGLKVTGTPAVRASAIGEPGGKSRVVTVGEDWLTIFLQPLSHALIANLRNDPSARAGLSRAWQGFEYVKSWSTKDGNAKPSQEERFILSSDLKTATDYCPRTYSRSLLKGFISGLNLEGTLSDVWADLVTGPRIYLGPNEDWAFTYTKRGVLMGDPGAKVTLSLFNRVAEMEAMLRYTLLPSKRPSLKFLLKKLREEGIPNTRFRLFAYAGDDHIAIGPEPYLREITRSHVRNGMEVSASSNFISDLAAFYCEEMIFIGENRVWGCWGKPIPLAQQPYEENPHVDALKIRLFSLCTKEHEGKNETNPAIGMASSLRGMIAWFAEGWEVIRPICSYRFLQKMRRLVPDNLVIGALPRSLGGIEVPVFGFLDSYLLSEWEKVPTPIRKAICLVKRETGPEVQALRRLLSMTSSATSARGIDLSSIEEEVRQVLSSELCLATPVTQLKPDHIDQLAWDNLRLVDKLKVVSRAGKYIPVSEALQVVMRPYIFRDLFFPEESIAHGIDPFRRRAYRQMSWPTRISRLVQAIEETVGKSDTLRQLYLGVEMSELDAVGKELISSFSQPYLVSPPKEINLIPKEVVYTENLCTLTTPDITILP